MQNFLVTHSLGGGTGSGVGTYVISVLHDDYPKVTRFSACVYPTEDDDVVTSPYNSILANAQLIEHADCVFPMDNHALQEFAQLERQQADLAVRRNKSIAMTDSPVKAKASASSSSRSSKSKGFDEMNAVAARMLCHVS